MFGAANFAVSWSSRDPAIASLEFNPTVDNTVTGRGVGETIIETATVGNTANGLRPGTAIVRVPAMRLTVEISPQTLVLEPGGQAQPTGTIRAARTGAVVTDEPVTWVSSDPTLAAVLPDGTVVGITDGTADITCQVRGASATATVTVTTPITVEIKPSALELAPDEVVFLTCIVRNARTDEVPGIAVEWESLDRSVATVDLGRVVAVGDGTTEIICRVPGRTSTSIKVTVKPFIVEQDRDEFELRPGGLTRMTCTVRKPDGEVVDWDVVWTSSNSDVATVDQNGNVTAVDPPDTPPTITHPCPHGPWDRHRR